MAAPSFVSAGSLVGNIIGITVNYPTGWTSGNVLLLFVETEGQTVAAPTGWTESGGSPQNTTGVGLQVFWRVAQSGDSGSVSVADSGDHTLGVILEYTGVDTSGATPFDVTPVGGVESTSDTSGDTGTSLTTSDSDCLVVVAFAGGTDNAVSNQFGSWANSNLTSLTERFDGGNGSGNGGQIGIVDGVKSAAGAVGSTTVTYTNASTKSFITLPLKAVAGGSPSSSDTSSASETQSLDQAISSTDSGSSAETQSLSVALTQIDSGVGTDTQSGGAPLTFSDTSSSTSTQSISTGITGTDTNGTVTESFSIAATVNNTDSRVATESHSVAATLSTSESRTISDFQSVNTGTGTGKPIGLIAVAVSATQINLSWTAFSGAISYDIKRNGSIIATNVATNSYNDTGLNPSTTYIYNVRAVLS